MTALAFTDTETTGLDPRLHDAWEIAVIRREADGTEREYLWQARVPLHFAQPEALTIGGYYQRHAVQGPYPAADMTCSPPGALGPYELAGEIRLALEDAILIGSNPAFDAAFLAKILRASGMQPPWHYRTVDVTTLAAGYMHGARDGAQDPGRKPAPAVPYSSHGVSRAVGVEPPGWGVAHTAMGDARWARDVYDAVTRGPGEVTT